MLIRAMLLYGGCNFDYEADLVLNARILICEGFDFDGVRAQLVLHELKPHLWQDMSRF